MNDVGEVTKFGHSMRAHFLFDSKWTNLNNGSFGTYPRPVRNALRGYQKLTEASPDKFLRYQYADLLDKARERVAQILNAPVDTCVFVVNATTGVNTVLRNLTWQPKDAIIYFDTVYGAVEKTLASLKETNPQIHLRQVGHGQDFGYNLPATHSAIINAFSQTISRLIYEGYTPKVAVFDTIVSLPGVRFPFERLTKMCKEYGTFSVIDGAHAVGQIPIDLTALDPDFFVSNCHKWLHTPRGCAVFYVPERNQHLVRTTLPTSHGYIPPPEFNVRTVLPPSQKSDFVRLFEFIGTADNSPFYCVPAALNFRANLCGGEEAILNYIRDVAQRGADLLATILGTEVMDDIGLDEEPNIISNNEEGVKKDSPIPWTTGGLRDCAMANVLLPIVITGSDSKAGSVDLGPEVAGPDAAGPGSELPPILNGGQELGSEHSRALENSQNPSPPTKASPGMKDDDEGLESVTIRKEDVKTHVDWMQKTMIDEFSTFVPIYEYRGRIWTRISGQIYLELKDFEWLGSVLRELCARIKSGESLQEQQEQPRIGKVEFDLEALGRDVEDVELERKQPKRAMSLTQAGWVEE